MLAIVLRLRKFDCNKCIEDACFFYLNLKSFQGPEWLVKVYISGNKLLL